MLRRSGLTSIWPAIGADVAQMDDMLLVEAVEKGRKAVLVNTAGRQHQRPHLRRSEGCQRLYAHASIDAYCMRRSYARAI